VSLVAGDPGTMMWGGELVLRDGVPVGQVTSAAWGAALGATAGLAYIREPAGDAVTPEFVRTGSYQVNVGGEIRPVTVTLRPPFDPAGERVRGSAAG
jgi:4-methylaminobutanoate oxidase (formaldehyde-forming)